MIVKRSISIRGHRTSISIEDAFWVRLQDIAATSDKALAAVVAGIDAERAPGTNLSSAIRLFVLADALSGERRGTPNPGIRFQHRSREPVQPEHK